MRKRRWVSLLVAVAVLAGVVTWALWPADPGYTSHDERLSVNGVTLDTRLYLPKTSEKVPALLLGHGFGGTKESVAEDAKEFAGRGYAVLTWTARGFGASTGQIHLNSPEHEVRDAQGLLDWLATRPEVRLDGSGDPRVGVMGGSYGGALALLLAGQDQRVDAIVPMITWNDLGNSLFTGGVFKKSWAGIFFSAGISRGLPAGGGGLLARGAAEQPVPGNPQCGRWARDICETYLRVAESGTLDDTAKALLATRSPAGTLSRIKAPTLLVQGEADSLFPLSEADANAKGITGANVRVAWFTGGHDGGTGPTSDQNRVKFLTLQWFDHYVKGAGEAPSGSFTYSSIAGLDPLERGSLATGFSYDDYPGLGGVDTASVPIAGPPQAIANPPNGTPAAISSLPQAGALSSVLNGVTADLPGQHGNWVSEPLRGSHNVVGSPTVHIRAASPTGEAVLFVKLYVVDQNNQPSLSNGLIAPVRLTGLPADIAQAQPVTVTLPAIVRNIEDGHRLRVVIATSDQSYLGPAQPMVYTVAADGAVTLPIVPPVPIATADAFWLYLLIGLVALLAVGAIVGVVLARMRLRRRDRTVVAEHADTPLHVRGLRKTYGSFVAVERIDFTVQRGQVVGLLGPNGAGKTTSLRVLMGLTQATAGDVLIFGQRLAPGAPVLSRIGALVEGPGFLPHLTGEQNLRAYWKATGRPWQDAKFEQALEIAGLGDAIGRRVKDYSHGMKQRLAVAQAMLGLPELLVLDEPTDGLDPPQIAEMRRVLQRYATDGRAVLVSSHLLAEVEQTCTHVVVMHKGVVVASGRVDEIVGDTPTTVFDVSDVDLAQKTLDRFDGVTYALDGSRSLVVELGELSRAEAIASLVQAGVGIDRVTPRRRLEDAFLALVGTSTAGSGDR
ncbi:CocE/NonD family hydrolase [Allorhizocola rhizosphaerae]|uniref:CocE/NonD family hydrolase n=1 Tax=Allorhizocola rhizosphaerae TaxID=1872709 RepID=UPI000E3C116E|nr:CocE/NonD family hydrolase [Allorhizocola rhizosphaerae]